MDWFDPNMPNLRMFLIKVIGLAGIVALWLFGALLMRAFLRHELPASESNRALGVATGPMEASFLWEAAMTPMQKAERDIEELRRTIRRMFRNHLSNLTLSPEDRAAISRGHSIATRRFEMGAEKI